MAVPSWFNAEVYFDNKLKAMGDGWDNLQLKAAFEAAGYGVDEDSLYKHFQEFGAHEGVSPTLYFDADEYYYAKTLSYFKVAKATEQQIASLKQILALNNMSAWEHYVEYGAGEGLNPSTYFDTSAYIKAKTAQMNAIEYEDRTDWTEAEVLDILAPGGKGAMTPLTHYFDYGIHEGLDAYGFTINEVAGDPGHTHLLTYYDDTSIGTNGDDYFFAGTGHLQDNDYIDGLGGNDVLEAYLNEANYYQNGTDLPSRSPLQPTIYRVEKIILRAQDFADVDAGNIQGQTSVNSEGMTWLQNDQSRATLWVDDVSADSNLMTIAWSNADPNRNVDFTVLFDSQNLKADSGGKSGVVSLEIMDVKNAQLSSQPLATNFYNSFTFEYTDNSGNAKLVKLTLLEADRAMWTGGTATYATLLQAFQNALAASEWADVFTVEPGTSYTASSTIGGITWSPTYVATHVDIKTTQGSISLTSELGATGWGAEGGVVPPDSSISTRAFAEGDQECPLIQTDIYLDNVGRVQWADASPECLPNNEIYGSESGDMVVGSMANRGGIERFDVIVGRGSWLSSLASTNEALRMVKVTNDLTNQNTKHEANEVGPGQLFIGRQLDDDIHFGYMNDYEDKGVGSTNYNAVEEYNWFGVGSWTDRAFLLSPTGLEDVKLFDASTFEGNLNIGASLTNTSLNKYLRDVDGVWLNDVKNPPLANADGYEEGEFVYMLGKASDILNMTVDSGLINDRDFKLEVAAGEGNDFINFSLANAVLTWNPDGTPATWEPITDRQIITSDNLRNVVLNGDGGADTIKVWGRTAVTANGGEGNDVIYVSQLSDESVGGAIVGEQNAVWIFNANSAFDRGIIVTNEGAQSLYNDILSTTDSVEYTAITATTDTLYVTVTFKGIRTQVPVALEVDQNAGNTAGTISTDDLNIAIAKAINNDPYLSKLLVAKDGAGYSMLVESLIDGLMDEGDLSIGLWTKSDGTGAVTGWGTNGGTQYYNTAFATAGNGDAGTFYNGAAGAVTPADGTTEASWVAVATAPAELLAGGIYTVTLGGVTYTTGTLAAPADTAALAIALAAAVDGDGNTLGSLWTITNPGAVAGALTFTANDLMEYDGTGHGLTIAGAAPGSGWGTDTFTAVDGDGAIFDLDLGLGTGYSLAAGSYTINVGGTAYTATLAATTTDAALITALLAATDSSGATLGSLWDITNADGTDEGNLQFESRNHDPASNTSAPSVVLNGPTTTTGPVSGMDTGTDSLNHVWGGGGNDVIVLNAGSDAAWHDVLEFHNTGAMSEGNDFVFNFQRGADKIDLSSYGDVQHIAGNYTGTGIKTIDKVTSTDLLSLVSTDFKATGVSTAITGAQLIQYDGGNEYILVYVNNTVGSSDVVVGEVTIVGTVTFANNTNEVAIGTLTDADLFV